VALVLTAELIEAPRLFFVVNFTQASTTPIMENSRDEQFSNGVITQLSRRTFAGGA